MSLISFGLYRGNALVLQVWLARRKNLASLKHQPHQRMHYESALVDYSNTLPIQGREEGGKECMTDMQERI
jgi:hypothetical protein